MNRYRFFFPIGFFVFFATITFYAAIVVADTAQEVTIAEVIKQQWDKPNQPVFVPVVVVSHDFSIADWIQETRGGRALLRLNAGHWQTLMCGDINLMQQKALTEAGVPAEDAKKLITSLTQAEAQLSVDQRMTINSFKGVIDLLKQPHYNEPSHE